MKRTQYTKESLREISFPLGGIGTGCIGLAGNGALADWEIFNRPNKGRDNGFSFNMPDNELGFAPVLPGVFRAPWFLDCAWGGFERTDGSTSLSVISGSLPLKKLHLPHLKSVRSVTVDGEEIQFAFKNGSLLLDAVISDRIYITE